MTSKKYKQIDFLDLTLEGKVRNTLKEKTLTRSFLTLLDAVRIPLRQRFLPMIFRLESQLEDFFENV